MQNQNLIKMSKSLLREATVIAKLLPIMNFSSKISSKRRTVQVQEIDYNQLISNDSLDSTLEKIDRAYGKHGVGTIAIRGVPRYLDRRQKALLLSWKLANLPLKSRQKLERPEHYYQVGWEHGEYGFKDGRDAYAGSLFSNPLSDQFIGEDGKMWQNAWPKEDLPEVESSVKSLALTMKVVAENFASHLDIYLKSLLPSFETRYFSQTVRATTKVNSRLVHYYPCDSTFNGKWIGWHKDIGMLTCLTPALYTNCKGEEIDWSDPESGLHAQTKSGEIVKLLVPKDCLIIQVGEAMEVLSGGLIKALPHSVIPARQKDISRNAFAMFIDPVAQEVMAIPKERSEKELLETDNIFGLLTPKL